MLDTVERQKQSVGRSTRNMPELIEQAEQICREEGYTDVQLATKFGIGKTQLYAGNGDTLSLRRS